MSKASEKQRDQKPPKAKIPNDVYEAELFRLQTECNYQPPPRELSTYVDDHVATLIGDTE